MEWQTTIGWVDLTLLAVVALSALVGAMRGLTFEVLSLAGWVIAWFAGLWLGPVLAPHIPIGDMGSALNDVVAFACAFGVVLVVWGMAARALSALVGRTLLRPLDRLLGAAFGVVRGLVVLLALATVLAYTPLAMSAAWRDALCAQWLNAILREFMPLVSPPPEELPGTRSV
jgi:membrane protein required for colicin V production